MQKLATRLYSRFCNGYRQGCLRKYLLFFRDLLRGRLYDVIASGTRREDMLLSREVMQRTWILRKYLSDMTTVEAMEFLQKQMGMTRDNAEFLATMNQ